MGVNSSRSPRILHILPIATGGGAAYALILAKHAAEKGSDVTLVAPARRLESTSYGVHHSRVTFRPLPVSPFWRSVEIMRLSRHADLIHAHGTRAATWALPTLSERPSVVTFHGLHLLHRRARRRDRPAATALLRELLRRVDGAICVSATEAAVLSRFAGRHPHVHIVRNAIAPPGADSAQDRLAARGRLELRENQIAVLVVGALNDQKDPLQALRVIQSVGAYPFVLLLAGDGPLRERVAAQAGANVRVLGHRSDVSHLLGASDVVLSTARWEGLPLALLEAMWASRPIVASAVTGNVDAVGSTGILVPQQDTRKYREALLRLLDPNVRVTLAERARARVERKFRIGTMLGETDRIYREAIARRRSAEH